MPTTYPAKLEDEFEIVDYISTNSVDEICEEMIEEFFAHSSLELVKLRVKDITPGNKDSNASSSSKQKRYAKLPSETRPPIVLDWTPSVADGNHRYRDAVAKGDEFIWAYVPSEVLEDKIIEVIERAPEDGLVIKDQPKLSNTQSIGMSL